MAKNALEKLAEAEEKIKSGSSIDEQSSRGGRIGQSAEASDYENTSEGSEILDLRRQLEEANKRAQQAEEERDSLRNSMGSNGVRPSEIVVKGNGWRFQVKVAGGKKAHLFGADGSPKVLTCCDESEAKRWYIVTTPDPENKNKQMSLSDVEIEVTCLDEEKRQAYVRHIRKKSKILSKFEAGISLTPEEMAFYQEHCDED